MSTNTLPMEFLTIKEQTYEIVDGYARSLLENGGGTGSGAAGNGISDWNQNDENGEGYIQNRPFYITREPSETEGIVEILSTTNFDIPSNGNYKGEDIYGIESFELGKSYTVVLNSTTYENVVCGDANGVAALGSLDSSFTDYPFLIGAKQGMFVIVAPSLSGTSCTISISSIGTVIDIGEMYIESKYAPHLQSDWNDDNETSINFIKNKPFGEKFENIDLVLETDPSGFQEQDALYCCEFLSSENFKEDKEYKVIFNSQEYTLKPHINVNLGLLLLGAPVVDINTFTFDFSEYPFVIFIQEDNGMFIGRFITETSGNHTFSISTYENIITKINEKFIPSQDWDAVPDQDGYIKNRPFYTDYANFGDAIVLYEQNIASGDFSVSSSSEYNYKTIYIGKNLSSKSRFGVKLAGNQYYPLKTSYDSNNGVYYLGDDFDTFLSGSSTYPFYIKFEEAASSIWLAITPEALSDSVAFTFVEFPPLIVPIDEKYIPDTIMRVGMIDEQYIPDTIMRTTDTLPKWNGKSMEIVTALPASPDENTFYIILES